MVELHVGGVDGAVVLDGAVVVATRVVEVAQVEARHRPAAALRVEAQELLEAVVGVVVVELLRADGGIVAGVGGGEVGTSGRTGGNLVVDLLRGGILLLLVEVGGLPVEVALAARSGLLLCRAG